MIISGLQKMTLLDYPGKVACTVFTQGCNFRCPFCHNSDLLGAAGPEEISREALFSFLKKRVGLLDAVCITGGEPTLHRDLDALLSDIKSLGYLTKLDTNGSRPEMLRSLVQRGLVDYVAMDIKNSPDRYGQTVGVPAMSLSAIEQSAAYLLEGRVDYEFRTTVAAQLHDAEAFEQIGLWLRRLSPEKKAGKYFIQPYVDRESVLMGGLSCPENRVLHDMERAIAPYVDFVHIRNLDE